jgi:hypothetical protein
MRYTKSHVQDIVVYPKNLQCPSPVVVCVSYLIHKVKLFGLTPQKTQLLANASV